MTTPPVSDADSSKFASPDDEFFLAQLQDMNNHLLDTQRELVRANRRAADADNAKDEFIARMSHDMRTPLNAIMGFNGLLLESLSKDPSELSQDDLENARRYVGYSDTSARFLLALISDILDYSKISKGELVLASEPFWFAACVDGADSMIRTQVEAKQIDYAFTNTVDAQRWYLGDKVRLQQILMNLLNNAVKYTPAGGKIRFSAEVVEAAESSNSDVETLRLTVADTGIGMDAGFQKQMFQPFSQERKSGPAGTSGVGLGLAIAKRIVDTMGGTIDVTSAKGEGSTFVVTIGLHLAEGGSAAGAASADSFDFSGVKVLVCDDNELNRILVREMLERRGCTVQEACNGQDALDAFCRNPEGTFDVVLMDIRMPIMDGYEATSAIRSSGRSDATSVCILALTADAFAEDVKRCLSCGMNGHIVKPIDPDALYRAIAGVGEKGAAVGGR